LTAFPPAWGYVVLVITSGLLFKAALTDLREYKIRNELVLSLAGLFILHATLVGSWTDLRWDLAFASLMFVFLLLFYGRGWLGGGDVKMLTVAFLWTGLPGAMPFAVLLAIFSLVHGLSARRGWVKSQRTESGGTRIPFAPSIAGALICILVLRALQGA
jgi:prepilin peptidase CpaA